VLRRNVENVNQMTDVRNKSYGLFDPEGVQYVSRDPMMFSDYIMSVN
jgi:hypothetical protein